MNTFICFKITQPFEEGKTSIPYMTTSKLPPILRFFYTLQNLKLENDLNTYSDCNLCGNIT